MSQSDYCRYKRISAELKNRKLASPILPEGDFVNFAKYAVHNNVANTAISYNRLLPTGRKNIFEMEKLTTNCPNYGFDNCPSS